MGYVVVDMSGMKSLKKGNGAHQSANISFTSFDWVKLDLVFTNDSSKTTDSKLSASKSPSGPGL